MNIDLVNTLARLGDDRELYLEFIQIFREDSPRRIAAIRESFERGDVEGAKHAAHNLRGFAASLGATQVVCATQLLETIAGSGDLSEWRPAFYKLELTLDTLDEELSEIENFGF